jgi:hypothetical protein
MEFNLSTFRELLHQIVGNLAISGRLVCVRTYQ